MIKKSLKLLSLICLTSAQTLIAGFEPPVTLTPETRPQQPTVAELMTQFQASRDQLAYLANSFRHNIEALNQAATNIGFEFTYDQTQNIRVNLFNYYKALREYIQRNFSDVEFGNSPLEGDEIQVIADHIKILFKSLAEQFATLPGSNIQLPNANLSPQEALDLIKQAIENAMNCALNIGAPLGLTCPRATQGATLVQRLTQYQNQIANLVNALQVFDNLMGHKQEEAESIIEEELPEVTSTPLPNRVQLADDTTATLIQALREVNDQLTTVHEEDLYLTQNILLQQAIERRNRIEQSLALNPKKAKKAKNEGLKQELEELIKKVKGA